MPSHDVNHHVNHRHRISPEITNFREHKKSPEALRLRGFLNEPGEIRTHDLLIRSRWTNLYFYCDLK